jgi:hypothetical protein
MGLSSLSSPGFSNCNALGAILRLDRYLSGILQSPARLVPHPLRMLLFVARVAPHSSAVQIRTPILASEHPIPSPISGKSFIYRQPSLLN